jgi:hypothetical protein
MINTLKRHAVALLASLAVSLPAAATTSGVDYTDMWWNSAENGWGVNVTQQGDVIFATMFVYAQDSSPHWFTGTLRPSGSTSYTGPLYQTTGSYYGNISFSGGPAVQVGNMTFNFATPYSGTLQYTANGVTVTKAVTRQTFANNNLQGNYLGGLTAQGTGCRNSPNGPILIHDTLTVTQTGQQLSMRVNFFQSGTGTNSQCIFSGTLTTQGRVGNVTNGTWSCTFGTSPGNQGTFTLDMVDASQNGFNARFSGSDQFCSYNGYFGGIRDVL